MLARVLHESGEYRLTGVGGDNMRKAGVATDIDSTGWGTVGLPDALRRIPYFMVQCRRLAKLIERRRPALVILVDFGAFNVRLGRAIRRLPFHQPIMYYFPPASWDKSARDRSPLAAVADVVATPFPWSETLLRKDGVNAYFVGHPVLERVQPPDDRQAVRRRLGLPAAAHYVGLLPGSRRIERRLLGPQMLQAVRLLREHDDYHFLWSAAPSRESGPEIRIPAELAQSVTVIENSVDIFQAADLVVTAFGTATLESTAAVCPMIGIYRGTRAMGLQFRLMRIPTAFYAMPNIIAEGPVVPELVQDQATGPGICTAVSTLFDTPSALQEMSEKLAAIRSGLGETGASKRAAQVALDAIAARSEENKG